MNNYKNILELESDKNTYKQNCVMNDKSLVSTLKIKCEKCEEEFPYTGHFFHKPFKIIDEIIQNLTRSFLKHNKEVHSALKTPLQEIYVLNKLIINNLNQVQDLKTKLTNRINQESCSIVAKKEYQESIIFLEQQLPKLQTFLQNRLEEKLKLVNSSQDKTNSQTQSNPDKFNWLYVIIPMGGVIILLLGIIVFQNWKKSQK